MEIQYDNLEPSDIIKLYLTNTEAKKYMNDDFFLRMKNKYGIENSKSDPYESFVCGIADGPAINIFNCIKVLNISGIETNLKIGFYKKRSLIKLLCDYILFCYQDQNKKMFDYFCLFLGDIIRKNIERYNITRYMAIEVLKIIFDLCIENEDSNLFISLIEDTGIKKYKLLFGTYGLYILSQKGKTEYLYEIIPYLSQNALDKIYKLAKSRRNQKTVNLIDNWINPTQY